MDGRGFLVCWTLALALLGVGCASRGPATAGAVQWKEYDSGRIAISFPRNSFEGITQGVRPKVVGSDSPWSIGPERLVLNLVRASQATVVFKEPRYYFPSRSEIFITPLSDASVKRFSAAYPILSNNARDLKVLLAENGDFGPWLDSRWNRQIPAGVPNLPAEPFNNAGRMMRAKFRLLSFENLLGFRLITYYANGKTGYGATNAELTYDFQGITRDGRYYVSARLGVNHPKLPMSMDDPKALSDNTEAEFVAEKKRVDSWKDESFIPDLLVLDQMIGSLRIQ